MTNGAPEPRTYIERDAREVELHGFCGGRAAVFSARAPEKATSNEDTAALLPYGESTGALVVADGAGGSRGGAQASAITVYELSSALEQGLSAGWTLREAILTGIEQASREIAALAIGAGSTVAVAELSGSRVRPYHVGDSQILLLGQKGKQKLLTLSHSPVGYAQHSGLIDEAQAMRHRDRHLVSNLLGVEDTTIEMGLETELSPRDSLLVACDGLFDNLSIGEIIEILRKGDLAEATEGLVDECLRRMTKPSSGRPSKPDDLTLIAFRLEE